MKTFLCFHIITEGFQDEICSLWEFHNSTGIFQGTEKIKIFPFKNTLEFLLGVFGCYLLV